MPNLYLTDITVRPKPTEGGTIDDAVQRLRNRLIEPVVQGYLVAIDRVTVSDRGDMRFVYRSVDDTLPSVLGEIHSEYPDMPVQVGLMFLPERTNSSQLSAWIDGTTNGVSALREYLRSCKDIGILPLITPQYDRFFLRLSMQSNQAPRSDLVHRDVASLPNTSVERFSILPTPPIYFSSRGLEEYVLEQ